MSGVDDYKVVCDEQINASSQIISTDEMKYAFIDSSKLNQPVQLNFGNGKLFLNKDNKLEFEGDMEKSAEAFLTYLCQIFNRN